MAKEYKKVSRLNALKEAVTGKISKPMGTPEEGEHIHSTSIAVLGAVEQSYGIYQVPSFREEVTTFWDDPLLKEGVTMFAEQVVATGVFYTSNPEYKLILPVTIKDKITNKDRVVNMSALEVILRWADDNNIRTKLLEIAIELKAFGNSLWRLDNKLGFIKIPIESVWHALRVNPDVPLQEQYHMQLTPYYGAKIIPWREFIHFRVGITGYHAPFGQGVVYSLLAKPTDSRGNVAPSIYDIRLSTRGALNEGFRKFSFGNELWVFEGMSNEDFEAGDIGNKVANMSSTGNRIATNAKGEIHLAVPERTQSYDEFIKQMRDEFFMALADPSLKLGLEEGFTKATSVTASEVYKFKIATMRNQIKEHFEDLFEQILDKLGFDGTEAAVKMNFGPEEKSEYEIKDIDIMIKDKVITPNEARKLLATYHKWDIQGNIEGGDKPIMAKPEFTNLNRRPEETGSKPPAKEGLSTFYSLPVNTAMVINVIIEELPDRVAGYNKDFSKVFIDPLVPEWMKPFIILHEIKEYKERQLGKDYDAAHRLATELEKQALVERGLNWESYSNTYLSLLPKIRSRGSKGPEELYKDDGPIEVK